MTFPQRFQQESHGPAHSEQAIRATDDDAASSRLSCVSRGYLEDPYAAAFVKKPVARPPLINIGTFVRTWAVDTLVQHFLSQDPNRPKQILSLGAGTDTRFFRLSDKLDPARSNLQRYVELDFAESTSRKAQTLKRQKVFADHVSGSTIEKGGAALRSPTYNLLPCDLRSFTEHSTSLVADDLLDQSVDTLVIAECLFVYLPPEVTLQILQWCASTFDSCCVVGYDPVNFTDAFGKMMVNNLRTRGLDLLSATAHTSAQSQSDRLQAAGFRYSQSMSVKDIRKQVLPEEETQRIAKLEMLDEVEELDLVLSHYAVSFGTNSDAMQGIHL